MDQHILPLERFHGVDAQIATPRLAARQPLEVEVTAEERIGRLFDRSHGRLFRLGCRIGGGPEAARDLVQEAFLRAARQPQALPADDEGAEAWLMRVLINLVRDEARKQAVRRRAAAAADPEMGAAGPEQALIARDLVRGALDALSPRRRAILALHELEELTVPEIARRLGITQATVRWHVALGRREMAARLSVHANRRLT